MADNTTVLQRIQDEFIKFENTMEELSLLKKVAADLRSYRRMIRIRKYD